MKKSSILWGMMRTAAHAALALGLIVLVACGSTESRLLGKWRSSDTGAVIEFFKDGRLLMGDKDRSVSGSWSVVSDERIKIDISRGAQYPTDSFTVTLQKDGTLATEAAGVTGTTFRKQ